MLHDELDADNDEMTLTRKIRRSFVEQRYEQFINALYQENQTLKIKSEIKYSDGKEFRMQTTVRIKEAPKLTDQRG